MGKFRDIWDSGKDGSSKAQRSFVRYAIVTFALFVLFLFVKKDNVIRWIQAGFSLSRQNRQMEMYRRQNAELDKRIRMMSCDRDTLETIAREEYYFCEPGDDVYILE